LQLVEWSIEFLWVYDYDYYQFVFQQIFTQLVSNFYLALEMVYLNEKMLILCCFQLLGFQNISIWMILKTFLYNLKKIPSTPFTRPSNVA
jgi:hypothetical protein